MFSKKSEGHGCGIVIGGGSGSYPDGDGLLMGPNGDGIDPTGLGPKPTVEPGI